MICKVQKSTFNSGGKISYLIYNESRSVYFETTSKAYRYLFTRNKMKVYIDLSHDLKRFRLVKDRYW